MTRPDAKEIERLIQDEALKIVEGLKALDGLAQAAMAENMEATMSAGQVVWFCHALTDMAWRACDAAEEVRGMVREDAA